MYVTAKSIKAKVTQCNTNSCVILDWACYKTNDALIMYKWMIIIIQAGALNVVIFIIVVIFIVIFVVSTVSECDFSIGLILPDYYAVHIIIRVR